MLSGDARHFPDSFGWLPDAADLGADLIRRVPHFGHLSEARIAYLGSQRVPTLHGHPAQALIAVPGVQGPLKWLYEFGLASMVAPQFGWQDPDFVMLIDAALWSSLDAIHREHLVYHELRHVEQRTDAETGIPKCSKEDGRPLLRLVPHDAEFFFDEVERYGPEVTGHVEATIALASGASAAQAREEARAHSGPGDRPSRGDQLSADRVHAGVRGRLPRGDRRGAVSDSPGGAG